MKKYLAVTLCAVSLALTANTASAKTSKAKAGKTRVNKKAAHSKTVGNALPLKADGCAHFTAGKGSYHFSVPDDGKALHSSVSGVLTSPSGETLHMARGIDTDSGVEFNFADLPEAGSYTIRFNSSGKVSACIE